MSFIALWTISLSLFDYDIILMISLALFFLFFLIFNVYRIAPDWKVTFLFYIVPIFLSISAYLDGY